MLRKYICSINCLSEIEHMIPPWAKCYWHNGSRITISLTAAIPDSLAFWANNLPEANQNKMLSNKTPKTYPQ